MASRRGTSCSAPTCTRRGHWVLLTVEPRSCEFRHTCQDAVAPAPSACHLPVTHAVFLAPVMDVGYCCLPNNSDLFVCVAHKCWQCLMQRVAGLELTFPLNWFNFWSFTLISILLQYHLFFCSSKICFSYIWILLLTTTEAYAIKS